MFTALWKKRKCGYPVFSPFPQMCHKQSESFRILSLSYSKTQDGLARANIILAFS